MPLALYFDENVDVSVAAGLQRHGIDVTTARDQGKLGVDDEEHLAFAFSQGRVLVTHDVADFAEMHRRWLATGKQHGGIAVSNVVAPGVLFRRLLRLCESASQTEAAGHFIFLGQFVG
jgi:predicted nuclease of predicted toxin-antitoxin system